MSNGLSSMIAGLALYVPEGARKRVRCLSRERGQAFIEYALLLTIVAIAVALIGEWSTFVSAITTALQTIEHVIQNPSSGSTP